MDKSDIILSSLFNGGGNFENYTWRPFREGVEIYSIYQIPNGPSAALLRYAPGARVPRHVHPAPEHIIVLQGSQSDERGTYPTGTLIVNLPNSEHDVASDEGCVVLAIWTATVQFVAS